METNVRIPRVPRPDLFLLAFLAASLAANAWLGLELKRRPARMATPEPERQLRVGDTVPPLAVVDASAQPASVGAGADGRPVVLYAYTTSCPWCQENLPAVRALAAQRSDAYRFVGLCLDPAVEACFSGEGPSFPRYAGLSREVVRSLGLGSVPQTIVVSADARVTRVWRGAFRGEKRKEVESFFDVALPGGGDKGR